MKVKSACWATACGGRVRSGANDDESKGSLQRDPVARVQAPREQLERVRPRRDATRRAQPALADDRHLAEVTMHIQRHRPHAPSPLSTVRAGRTSGQTTSTDPRSRRNRASRKGRPVKSPGSTRPSRKRPAHPAFSQRSPSGPVTATYARPRTVRTSTGSFMPGEASASPAVAGLHDSLRVPIDGGAARLFRRPCAGCWGGGVSHVEMPSRIVSSPSSNSVSASTSRA